MNSTVVPMVVLTAMVLVTVTSGERAAAEAVVAVDAAG